MVRMRPRPAILFHSLFFLASDRGCSLLSSYACTVFRFVRVSAKFGNCTFESVNVTLVAAKMCTFTLESTHLIFNKCPIYTYDGASAKFSTNSHETVYSVRVLKKETRTQDCNTHAIRISINVYSKHNFQGSNLAKLVIFLKI